MNVQEKVMGIILTPMLNVSILMFVSHVLNVRTVTNVH